MMPALLQFSNSILCWSCFSSATVLDFQSSSQGLIHKSILANIRFFMLTIQLYLYLYFFVVFFLFWDLAIVIILPSVANKLQCIVELLVCTMGGRFIFQVTDLLLFPTFTQGSVLFVYFFVCSHDNSRSPAFCVQKRCFAVVILNCITVCAIQSHRRVLSVVYAFSKDASQPPYLATVPSWTKWSFHGLWEECFTPTLVSFLPNA